MTQHIYRCEELWFTGENKKQVMKFAKDRGFYDNNISDEEILEDIILVDDESDFVVWVEGTETIIDASPLIIPKNNNAVFVGGEYPWKLIAKTKDWAECNPNMDFLCSEEW